MKRFIEKQSAYSILRPILADDHSRQTTSEQLVLVAAKLLDGDAKVLDLGCGDGRSREFFLETTSAHWFGVDIAYPPDLRAELQQDKCLTLYDGVNLPYRESSFDLVYSRQVLEHVRHPDRLLLDLARVLKPGGRFVGSVSYLEPYHAQSIFNFTPYGLMRVLEDAGLEVLEVRPGVDGATLMVRQMLMRSRLMEWSFRYSPLNLMIALLGRVLGLGHQHLNFFKLQFAGHLGFVARKPIARDPG